MAADRGGYCKYNDNKKPEKKLKPSERAVVGPLAAVAAAASWQTGRLPGEISSDGGGFYLGLHPSAIEFE